MATLRTLGDYLVGPTLGEGGFSKVKLGTHATTGRKVALKLLKSKSSAGSSREAVEREVEMMTQIKHPNVIELIECNWACPYPKRNGKSKKVILIVLELAQGGELFEFLSFTGAFEDTLAKAYFKQLVDAMNFCHDKGIVHRDLKPENMLLDNNMQLKLADFGFANIVAAENSLMFTECGTPGYMAPEMVKNQGYDGKLADIFSAGVILFIMLSGFPPFQEISSRDWWFDKLKKGKARLFWKAHARNATYSQTVMDLIQRMLQPDPAKRITMEEILEHPWMQEACPTAEELPAVMEQRKLDVASHKERAAREKRSAVGSMSPASSLDDGVTMRGDGDDEELADMPAAPPTLVQAAKLFRAPETGAELNDQVEMDFDDASEEEAEEVEPVAEDYDYKNNLPCYTAFYSAEHPSMLAHRISGALKNSGATLKSTGNVLKMKATAPGAQGSVSVTVQIFNDPTNTAGTDSSYVTFKRRKGTAADFHPLYQQVRTQVLDMVHFSADTGVTA